jgi:hypothetical protein
METGPPRGPEGLPSTLFTPMVSALGPLAMPPRGPTVDVFCIDGGRSLISDIASQGATVNIFCVDGGHSRIFGTASQGSTVNIFLALMVGAPGSPASPPRGASIDVFQR